MNTLIFSGGISLDEIIKSTNSEASNVSSGNDGLKKEFQKHFSNKLAPVLLDVYDSWRKLGTIYVTSRIGIISAIYEKSDKKYCKVQTISILNLDYKIYTTNS